jgi:UDP-GlcNAc:undecaprenyl-phosphate GlcNAc-1-phosphate transferase
MSRHFTGESTALLAIALVGSFLVSLVVVAIARVSFRQAHFVDRPNANTGNCGGAAMGGGLVVIAVIFISSLLLLEVNDLFWRVMPTMLAVCLFGLLDDIYRIRPFVKVFGQLICGGLYVVRLEPEAEVAVVLMLLLVLSSNAWNVVDVMDSLLGSIGTMCFLGASLVFVIYGAEAAALSTLSLISAGSIAGFLMWNRHPASIILGDSGSLALGMLFGMVVIESFMISPLLAIPVLLSGLIPYLEVAFLIVQRSRKRIPFYETTPDHFALRMLHNGYSVHYILTWVWTVGFGLTLVASFLVISRFHPAVSIGTSLVMLCGCFLAFRYFDRLPARAANPRQLS